ncbi:hypothetical protein ACWEPC_47380 [Nonomuraea sp. NPDC004297]
MIQYGRRTSAAPTGAAGTCRRRVPSRPTRWPSAGGCPSTSTPAWLPPDFADGLNLVLPPRDSVLFTATFNGERRKERATGPSGFGADLAALASGVRDYLLLAFIAHRRSYPPGVSHLDGEVSSAG